MRIIADLHIHSKYSRATSADMDLDGLSRWGRIKGIELLGTGDFTHPLWLEELKERLTPLGNGFFEYNAQKFMLTTEVSNVYWAGGKLKKIHNLIFAPSFEIVEQINDALSRFGDLASDGRPTLSCTAPELTEIIMQISPQCIIVPAHVWTPWFSLFGSNSGFDSVEECFDDQARNIHALETGLSSNPEMNWRLSSLDKYALISNSDSHSLQKIGREANVFELEEVSYSEIISAIKEKDKARFRYTYEFFPEEGKYHFDGHRNCGVRLSPSESKKFGNICPVCKRPLTIGVMHRIEELADREAGFVPENAIPFESRIPLQEIIAKVLGKSEFTKSVQDEYFKIVNALGSEFNALEAGFDEIAKVAGERIADAIVKVQEKKVKILAGYDGVYGKIEILGIKGRGKNGGEEESKAKGQKTLAEF